MAKKRHTSEQIIRKLREAEIGLAKGQAMAAVLISSIGGGVGDPTLARTAGSRIAQECAA